MYLPKLVLDLVDSLVEIKDMQGHFISPFENLPLSDLGVLYQCAPAPRFVLRSLSFPIALSSTEWRP